MVKVVIASLKSRRKGSASGASVTKKRVKDASGQVRTLRTLDAGSSTFGEDLRYVFGKNVAKARRENRRAVGASDLAVVKR